VTVIVLESHRTWQARQTDGAGRADRASPLFRSLPAVPKAVTGEVLVEVAERQRQDVRKALVSEVIYLVFLLAVALVLGAGIVWTESEKQRLVARLMLLYLYGPMLVLIAIERSVDWVRRWRSLRQRIGTDGSAMLYDEGSGEVRRYGWNAVVTNGRALLADSTMIHLYGGKRYDPTSVFAAEALRECVLARLPRSAFVGELRFWWTALLRGNAAARWQCAVITLVLCVGLLSEIRPDLIATLKAMYLGFLKSKMS
jgi:hypothetical protein